MFKSFWNYLFGKKEEVKSDVKISLDAFLQYNHIQIITLYNKNLSQDELIKTLTALLFSIKSGSLDSVFFESIKLSCGESIATVIAHNINQLTLASQNPNKGEQLIYPSEVFGGRQ